VAFKCIFYGSSCTCHSTSAELFFSCCDSVAAPRLQSGHHDQCQVPAKNKRAAPRSVTRDAQQAPPWATAWTDRHQAQLPARRRGQRPVATIEYLRRTTSAAAGNDMGNTLNTHSTAMHNERLRGQRPGQNDQVSATHNERRCGQRYLRCTRRRPGHHLQVPARRRGYRPGQHDQVPARRRMHRSWHHDQKPATLNERRRG
jgi:hypothetical protein